jgi:hypothetical protein
VYNLFHSALLRPATPEELALNDRDFEKRFGKEAKALRKHLANPKAPADVEVWPYNQVVEAVLQLRTLHVQLDNAVRDAYGWQDLNLEHAFYDVDTLPENDRTRYTISPAARNEVLKRLLALNHERHAEEVAKGLWEKKKGKVKAPKAKAKQSARPDAPELPLELEALPMAAEPQGDFKRGRGRPRKGEETDTSAAAEAILAWLQSHPGLHGKSAILEGTGVHTSAWNSAIKGLVEEGKVRKEGAKKGARYGV